MSLFIVATPIGNLKDVTLRALEVLKSVDYIFAEDTRVTRKLLAHYGIKKSLLSFHEYSSQKDLQKIINLLQQGKNLAYVVDAGTPGISDPGGYLVRQVSGALPEEKIIPIPGASALIAALSVAGLPRDQFLFLGFPPAKKGRKRFFQQVLESKYPVVLYESPHRLTRTIHELSDIGLSMFECILIKEISKVYEQVVRMSIGELQKVISTEKKLRGEFVLVINKNIR
ncbi:MAG: 16S rRNA (cytidine(1402)-2'-O)-methyltransferase [Candidatus Ryanbacteria bacterium RIFCSPHIGHO2_12_FULL_47_12b]|uniref:Ribosomal RNA small subunit methyltransferase I n=3 Tax=Parcubacteria group TaxID=1794811 RepID=A0A1G2H4M3_9BACT|nr:MAG: Ribosomal RNA small subunit methyltransferase I [Parcubacteria group bacterium GW2011_GWA2_47_10b]KKU76285.1 MAG: Ribosomal RNA small subunit methyltransferase I [Candidatus Giovannonibacteria bacterium GW2011_GWB1_47_6b]OGZ44374.1 MAG: 16S rRNA (cytidine(1402)-2'-O)-methyltransferase [Candidatus Ryanbacteria bacterium RIFCSPHIGHO2_01_FULL_48_80]OGZ48032.1 MAG: 16S rRNA (cytidine(1402)-2'-O)-methyltransferase [Candidatus Ryanbacteria bacterium RIFCSPHIGHO2_02_FULL_47_25]OGZ52413.1 MAG: 